MQSGSGFGASWLSSLRTTLTLAKLRAGHVRKTFSYALAAVVFGSSAVAEVDTNHAPNCYDDAMLIFDGSGSMSGIEEGGRAALIPRIDAARQALAEALPRVTPYRRLGLLTYGPKGGCETQVNLLPEANAAAKIIAEVDKMVPTGLTPIAAAVEQAAGLLDYRNKPALVVLLTDGAETCEGHPCALARKLKANAKAITVHVIGYRMQDLLLARERGVSDMKCLAGQTGGQYIGAESIDELVAALNKTLGCPLVTEKSLPRRFLERPQIFRQTPG